MFGTLFVSAPLYASLRLGEAQIREHTAKVESGSFKDAEDAEGDSSEEHAEAEKSSKSKAPEESAEEEKATEKPAKKPARATIEIHRVNLNG